MIDLKNLKGFVFYVDMLGFTALTQDKIQLTKDDFNIWQVSKYFSDFRKSGICSQYTDSIS